MNTVPSTDPRHDAFFAELKALEDKYGAILIAEGWGLVLLEPDGTTVNLGPIGLGVPSPGGA